MSLYITDDGLVLDNRGSSFPSLLLSVTDKAQRALFHFDPQLPGPIISDRC